MYFQVQLIVITANINYLAVYIYVKVLVIGFLVFCETIRN